MGVPFHCFTLGLAFHSFTVSPQGCHLIVSLFHAISLSGAGVGVCFHVSPVHTPKCFLGTIGSLKRMTEQFHPTVSLGVHHFHLWKPLKRVSDKAKLQNMGLNVKFNVSPHLPLFQFFRSFRVFDHCMNEWMFSRSSSGPCFFCNFQVISGWHRVAMPSWHSWNQSSWNNWKDENTRYQYHAEEAQQYPDFEIPNNWKSTPTFYDENITFGLQFHRTFHCTFEYITPPPQQIRDFSSAGSLTPSSLRASESEPFSVTVFFSMGVNSTSFGKDWSKFTQPKAFHERTACDSYVSRNDRISTLGTRARVASWLFFRCAANFSVLRFQYSSMFSRIVFNRHSRFQSSRAQISTDTTFSDFTALSKKEKQRGLFLSQAGPWSPKDVFRGGNRCSNQPLEEEFSNFTWSA